MSISNYEFLSPLLEGEVPTLSDYEAISAARY